MTVAIGNYAADFEASVIRVVDVAFFMALHSASIVEIQFDTNDYLYYDRANNRYRFYIGSTALFEVSESVAGQRGQFIVGTPGAEAGLFRISGQNTYPASIELDGRGGASGDTDWTIDTYGNAIRFMSVAGTEYFHFHPTGLEVVGYARIGSVSAPANTGTGDLTVDGKFRCESDIDHNGANVGFFGKAPAARAAAYTPTNVVTDRNYDANATTTDELADVLGTLIADLQSYGLLQ